MRAFPRYSEGSEAQSPQHPAFLRAFGSAPDDVTVDFGSGSRVQLVTDLLARCSITASGEPASVASIWDLSVSTRILALLALAEMAEPVPLEWHVQCSYADCLTDSEISIEFDEIKEFAAAIPQDKRIQIGLGHETVWLRRPTGADQLAWLPHFSGRQDPAAAIIAQLIEGDNLAAPMDDIAAAIDTAVQRYDPLVCFTVNVRCVECERVSEHELDLSEAAIQRLWRAQLKRLEDIDAIARAYHWSEAEILALPDWRRGAYLNLIAGEAS